MSDNSAKNLFLFGLSALALLSSFQLCQMSKKLEQQAAKVAELAATEKAKHKEILETDQKGKENATHELLQTMLMM